MKQVGDAICDFLKLDSCVREDLCIVSKVSDKAAKKGASAILAEFQETLKELQLNYVDLLLLHNPLSTTHTFFHSNWKCLESLKKTLKVRNIGVCNFTIDDLKELHKISNIYPSCNQFEASPFNIKYDLINYCHENNISVMLHSPLYRNLKLKDVNLQLDHIAVKHKTSVQIIILSFLHQVIQCKTILVSSDNVHHLKQNLNLDIQLDSNDLNTLSSIKYNGFSYFKK